MKHLLSIFSITLILVSCGGDGSSSGQITDEYDLVLRPTLAILGIKGSPDSDEQLVNIDTPLAQLGKKLFFSKSLGGGKDVACASCHHPSLGGGDALSMSIGVEAIDENVLGLGRENQAGDFPVPRNAPSTFNTFFYQNGLFWDSRVEQLSGGIRTPDTPFMTIDTNAGDNLLMAQARFPVVSVDEMKTDSFENGSNNEDVRNHLAARFGGYDGGYNAGNELLTNNWLLEFQTAYGSNEDAESLITFDNIVRAIAAYQRSQVFKDTPWKAYVEGDSNAISKAAKRGAILFYFKADEGGAGCFQCHNTDFFTDEQHHVIGFPQIGVGKGDGINGSEDFGRERETGNQADRYRFRTPTLLNVSVTAPYGHAGAYETLEQVVRHYSRPQNAIDLFNDPDWCQNLGQFTDINDCSALFPDARANTQRAVNRANRQPQGEGIPNINLDDQQVEDLVAFLESLTDPCVSDRECLSPWIPEPEEAADENQLHATDRFGLQL